jgi:hypothetical protein
VKKDLNRHLSKEDRCQKTNEKMLKITIALKENFDAVN